MEGVEPISPLQLADIVRNEKALVVDARTFCEYNTCHIFNSINVWCSKLRKKRLQQNAISVFDYLQQACQVGLQEATPNEVVVYDQNSQDVTAVPHDTFVRVLLHKLTSAFKKVFLLSGGFLLFQALYPELCEDSTQKITPLTSLSQPCMPVARSGSTRILPFLFLGSQYDANNKQMLMEHNIMYELNVSTSCAKPEFLQDSHFLRIPVNDSFSEKLLPYFGEAFRFIDKVREAGGRVLVHCLAGISRSPTVAIAYVMKHLGLHYDEAYRYVKKRRPTISPNINFVGQLLELDKQLLGEGSLYRSPTTPLCLEYDASLSPDLQPSPESLILKSSSSSCLESNKKEVPFSPKRSLPSLQLQDSTESDERSFPLTPDEPSLALLSLVTESLPPSPVVTPLESSTSGGLHPSPSFPGQPDPLVSKCSDTKSSSTSSQNSGNETLERFFKSNKDLFQNRRLCRTVSTDSQPQFANRDSPICVNKTNKVNASRHSDVIVTRNSENYSTTALINVSCPDKAYRDIEQDKNRRKSICVIEVTHEKSPITFIHEDTKPMIIRETPVLADPADEESSSTSSSGVTQKQAKQDIEELDAPSVVSKMPSPVEKSNSLPATRSKPPIAVPPASESSSRTSTTPGAIPPPSPSKQLTPSASFSSRRMETKHLPRSYSSSETHLNTRRLLESQGAATPPETCTRKSFSTDEVSKAWSQQSSPQTPSQPHLPGAFSKDEAFILTSPSELARCDSWSTSGLGSEISDGDSQQGDIHSLLLDESQGPYDAVFADIYPGESTEVVFRDSCKKVSSAREPEADCKQLKCEQKSSKSSSRSQRLPHRPASQTLSLKSGSKETLGGCPPRPVSLPGVTGTYNVRLKSHSDQNSSIDMGVELDESPDWQSEKGQEVFKYEPAKSAAIKTPAVEHPPVSSRTMGDDVKHMMTWFKIEPLPRGSASAKKPNVEKNADRKQSPKTDPVVRQQEERQTQSKSSTLSPKSKSTKENNESQEKKEICKSKSEKQLPKLRENRPVKSISRENAKDASPQAEKEAAKQKANGTRSSSARPKGTKGATIMLEPEEDVQSHGAKPNGDHEGASKSFPTIDDHLYWWDSEFKRKIKNIQKHVSLKSWDVAPEDKLSEENLPSESSGLAGIQLAQELMQSMENLLESEISDIKRQADVLRDRFGLGESSSHKEFRDDRECGGRSINVTFRPCVLRHQNQSPFFKNPNRASITLPINYSISELSAGIQSKKDGASSNKALQDKTNWSDFAQSDRAKSEPPMGADEGLYRARSCPGLQGKLEDPSKDPSAKGILCVTLRSRPPNYSKESNRYSWTAPPEIIPLTPPAFESCPDISKLKSYLLDGTSNSSGSSRLLPVS